MHERERMSENLNGKETVQSLSTIVNFNSFIRDCGGVEEKRHLPRSLPRSDEQKCMRKKRYDTKQINTHPTNERSLFEGSVECAEWDRQRDGLTVRDREYGNWERGWTNVKANRSKRSSGLSLHVELSCAVVKRAWL